MLKITSIRIKNFRTFIDSGEIPIHDGITILIGENGSGKTSILRVLDLFFNNKTPTLNNEHAENTDIPDRNKPISFIIKFQLSGNEEYNDFIKRYSENSMLTIEYYIDDTNNPELEYYIHHKIFKNDNLNNDKYRTLSAAKLADLVDSLGIAKGKNKQANTIIIEQYIMDNLSSADKKDGKEKIKFKDLELLPRLEIYSSENYDDPISLIKNTLENTYREKFYITTEENKNQTLKPEYLTLKEEIQNDLDEKVNKELKNKLSMHMNGIDSVESVCNIDFSKSLQLNDIIISRNGKRTHVSNLPQGEKNKAQLAIMEWSNDKSASNNVPIIRCYDEPDANLDYMAQKKKLNIIKNNINENSQAIICTHSLMLINSAPASTINKLNIKNGETTVEYLTGDGDEEIEKFLGQVAEISGLPNTSLFYEKAYIIFEGESEAESLSELFHTYTGNYFADLGIASINLGTNGQWKNALKFLGAKRKDLITMLLDKDSLDESSGCNINRKSLEEAKFDENFLRNNCFFIGTKEFEDTYTDAQLAKMANIYFQKKSGNVWTESDFSSIRKSVKRLNFAALQRSKTECNKASDSIIHG